jgi:hypothetical protein
MGGIADSDGRIEYPGSEYPDRNSREHRSPTGIRAEHELEVVVELVSVDGPEGERLEELQAQAVRRVLESLLPQRERTTESKGDRP